MPLTFIHTADWHLGHTYWKIGPRAAHSWEWRFDAVRRIWDLAVQRKADFVLAAGDIFDSDTPSDTVRQKALEVLADAPVPVFLISGNHDPCAEGSIWMHSEFCQAVQQLKTVRPVLRAQAEEAAPGVRLFPCPVRRKYSREDATAWIPEAERGGDFRIGLAHGHWRGYYSAGGEQTLNVIDPARAEKCGLDYLALGDYHSYTPAEHAAARARTYYAGTPEIGARDNVRGGHVLCVTLPEPGAAPEVEPCFVGRIQLEDWGTLRLAGGADLESLRQHAAALSGTENTILRLRLAGQVAPSVAAEVDAWLAELRDRFLGVDVTRAELQTMPGAADFAALNLERVEDAILRALSQPLGEDAAGLAAGAASAVNWSRDEAARSQALALYYRLLKEV